MPMMQMPAFEEGKKEKLPSGQYRAYDIETSGSHLSVLVNHEFNRALHENVSGTFFIYHQKSNGPGGEVPVEGWDTVKVHIANVNGKTSVSMTGADGNMVILPEIYEADIVKKALNIPGKLTIDTHNLIVP